MGVSGGSWSGVGRQGGDERDVPGAVYGGCGPGQGRTEGHLPRVYEKRKYRPNLGRSPFAMGRGRCDSNRSRTPRGRFRGPTQVVRPDVGDPPRTHTGKKGPEVLSTVPGK